MKRFLIKENADWADEFDLEGFLLMKADSREEVIDRLKKRKDINENSYPIDLFFGTNEWQEIDDEEHLLDMLDIREIPEDRYDILLELFPYSDKTAFGTTAIL